MNIDSRKPSHASDANLSRQRSQDSQCSSQRLRPVFSRGETCSPRIESYHYAYCDPESKSPLQSTASFESTVPSEGNFSNDLADFAVAATPWSGDAMPATSRDFSVLFPSSRRLEIRHDDATIDGNMNLRIDTPVKIPGGEKRKITLFHLRMHGLRQREFSLRRYSRDSGHDVCTSSRKSQTARQRPFFARSLSNAMSPFKSKSDDTSNLRRHDSGYDSMDGEEERAPKSVKAEARKNAIPKSSDVIGLEFSNYSRLDMRRKGLKSDKHYDFEYWGSRYSWKMVTRKAFDLTQVSFHLLRRNDQQIVAHIVPEQLTDEEAKEEQEAGGWVPPCSMWISDATIIQNIADISDVVVATGIVALVDVAIRRHFHEKETRHLVIPMPLMAPLQFNLDHIGPKHLIEEAFGRGKQQQAV